MVVDALVFHPTVAHYLRFAATTVGRDKLMRTLQYFARFYVWYRLRTNATAAEIAPWDALKAVLSKARKLLQAGKNIEHFKAAAVAAQDPKLAALASDSGGAVLRYATIGRQLGYAGYLSLELALLPESLGVRKLANRALAVRLRRDASRLQLLCDACDLTNTTSSLGWIAFDDGVVGLAGTVSSLVGVYNQWRKTA
ncbi:peroxisomal biogenesis factor [Niveomyces insectorum RCEF 264]|uniref:Peroxisomal biogenesis factor n=1 Tax=Niveomyces insectorum RCEF 264 TaxID=1081102 RepID=A0A167ZYC9_9HYPO|nr:peroxisomal biogenesis factor [Niveomyces insectorum RCEF 264]